MSRTEVAFITHPVRVGGAVLIRLSGSLSADHLKSAAGITLTFVENGERKIVLKLEGTKDLDADGAGELVALAAATRAKGGALALAGPFPTDILNALVAYGVNTTVPMFSSGEEAILMVSATNPASLQKAQTGFARTPLREARQLPTRIRAIYDETYLSLSYGFRILAGIGIRALVEAVCKDLSAEGRTLEKRIDDLVKKGHLTANGADVLHRTRLLGNRAAHEVEAATLEQLNAALDIAEHLLTGTYVLPHAASKLPR